MKCEKSLPVTRCFLKVLPTRSKREHEILLQPCDVSLVRPRAIVDTDRAYQRGIELVTEIESLDLLRELSDSGIDIVGSRKVEQRFR